jgi:hypothetical protein
MSEVGQCVKGSHIIQAVDWIDARLGPGTFRQLTERGGPRWRAPLPSSWYEVDILQEALAVVCDKLQLPLERVAADIARLNAEHDLTSLYRFFMRLAQPQRLLSFTPRLWATYVSFGAAAAVTNEPGFYVGQGVAIPADMLDWACGSWSGFIPTAVEIAGGRDVKHRIIDRHVDDGHATLKLEVRYR